MDVVRKWVGLVIVAALIFVLGFAGGSIFMGRETAKAFARIERDVKRERIEILGAAQMEITAREAMLGIMSQQIAKLSGENAWLQRKLSDFTRTSL